MATQRCETRKFTRQEFYEYVWTAPATKLAKELGCSDVMIGKVCKSYDIPKPYSGYWAKLAHGKAPTKTPLPINDQEQFQNLTFYKYPEVQATLNEPPRESLYDDDILELLAKAKQLGPVEVSKTLRSPHPLIARTKKEWKRRKAESKIPWCDRVFDHERKRVKTLAIQVSAAQESRALRFMDALIKRLEKVGGTLEIRECGYNDRDHQTFIVIAGECITRIRLREKHNQVKTINENAEFSWDRNRTDLVPSGLLLIDNGPSSYQGPLLKDKKNSTLEDGLTAMVNDLIVRAGENRIHRRAREAQERQRVIDEKLQRERDELISQAKADLSHRQEEEQAKVDELFHHFQCWKESQMLREYLTSYEEHARANSESVDLDKQVKDYVVWGLEQADRIDPFSASPHSVLDETIDESDERFEIRNPK